MPELDLVSKGMTTCQGCAMELIARSALEVLGPKTITMTPPSCSAIITGNGDETGWGIPCVQTVLMSLPAFASGVSEALKIQGKNDVNVMGYAGDGGTFDIGFQALSGAIERGHKAIYICCNNEAYMNTGGQRSSATTLGATTKTTPTGKKEVSKNIDFMLLHTPLVYQATASVGDIKDFKRKVAKAATKDGPCFIHVMSPCPSGWKFPTDQTIQIAKRPLRAACGCSGSVKAARSPSTASPRILTRSLSICTASTASIALRTSLLSALSATRRRAMIRCSSFPRSTSYKNSIPWAQAAAESSLRLIC